MICGEINAGGSAFIMELADRIIRLNEKRSSGEKVTWYGLYLMIFTPDELKHLKKAGFLGGWYDVVSLDDRNLQAIKMPYNSKDMIQNMIDSQPVVDEILGQDGHNRLSLEERIFRYLQKGPDSINRRHWSFFLGNTAMTPESIRTTLKAADDADFSERFDFCHVTKYTRVYDYQHPDDELLHYTASMTDRGPADAYDELYPSFAYPPALVQHFGSTEGVEEFTVIVTDTYLSCHHLFMKEWNWFLAKSMDVATFATWWKTAIQSQSDLDFLTPIPEVLDFLIFLKENPTVENVQLLFNPTPGRRALMNWAAYRAMHFVLLCKEEELIPVVKFLDLPLSFEEIFALSPYKIAVKLFASYADKKELLAALDTSSLNGVLARFLVEYLLYFNNMPLKAEYRPFFAESDLNRDTSTP